MAQLSLLRPAHAQVARLVELQSGAPLTYTEVGGTADDVMPAGYHLDEHSEVLGSGEAVFDAARAALRRWAQFDLSWVFPVSTDVPIAEGEVFSFVSKSVGVWSVNVCRIVYVVDERDESSARFGFAYGTVGTHGVRGEERFLVEWQFDTGEVRFGIRKFSVPAHPLLRAVLPLTLWVQRKFTREALLRMKDEVAR